jgi:transposase-like protein
VGELIQTVIPLGLWHVKKVIALGVTMEGRKIPLGFVQTEVENERVGREMLEGLLERGSESRVHKAYAMG